VVEDSLSYWEKQSTNYDGVLGVCSYLPCASQLNADRY
jgi:hypothetical protein